MLPLSDRHARRRVNFQEINMHTLTDEINRLKNEKDAVILAHYYVSDEVQGIADYIGDSYYLSKLAAALQNRTIVFCGVAFMGESAKILSPGKTVLMPDSSADCPMAHMTDPIAIRMIREKYEDLAVVCYINSTAEVKAEADVCVTSANACRIIKKLPAKNIYFIPDANLGRYLATQIPEKNFILNDGFCPVHESLTVQNVKESKRCRPHAEILAHPECTAQVLAEADFIGSTSAIIEYAAEAEAVEFIICTEEGVLCELKRRNPEKIFHLVSGRQVCENMKKVTLEKVAECLSAGGHGVEVPESLRERAAVSLEKMLAFAAD